MNDSTPIKKPRKRKAVFIMNTSKHAFWTDRGRVAKGAIAQCSSEVATQLVERGDAERVKQDE